MRFDIFLHRATSSPVYHEYEQSKETISDERYVSSDQESGSDQKKTFKVSKVRDESDQKRYTEDSFTY